MAGGICAGVRGTVVCLGDEALGGGVGVFVGGAEVFSLGLEGFGLGAGGVGTASGLSFGWLGSSLVSISVAEASVIFRLLVVFFLGEGSEGFASDGLAAAGSASSVALRFLESLSMIEALWVFTISSTSALIFPL